jgi:hypothetical protein
MLLNFKLLSFITIGLDTRRVCFKMTNKRPLSTENFITNNK